MLIGELEVDYDVQLSQGARPLFGFCLKSARQDHVRAGVE